MTSSKVKILFVTTQLPDTIKAEWPLQNYTLPRVMEERGSTVSIISWRDEKLTTEKIATFDVVTFLWCNIYDQYPLEFENFIRERLEPAKLRSSTLKVMNDNTIILWNYDKVIYLQQLQTAGFTVPKTEYIEDIDLFESVDSFAYEVTRLAKVVSGSSTNSSVVIKPSISSSSKQTYLMSDPSCMSSIDLDYLMALYRTGTDGSLMIQAYEPDIASGEYSLVYIATSFTFAIHKIPSYGEFRCQQEFGGSTVEMAINSIPNNIMTVAEDVIRYIGTNVGQLMYCRVDGIVRHSGEFVIMEVEAIEPDLYLEVSQDDQAKERLYQALELAI